MSKRLPANGARHGSLSNPATICGSPRKDCRSSERLPEGAMPTLDRRAGGIRRAHVAAGRCAGGDRAQPARRPGTGDCWRARGIAAAPGDGHRGRAREAGGRGRRDAGHRSRPERHGRMVRSDAAARASTATRCKRLREEIEPVSSQDFMRFLFRWQHVIPDERREGPDALDAVIAQLQGFEAPAAAWESEILPARLDNYDFTWLDDLCLSGRAVWTRLTLPAHHIGDRISPGPIRTTPVTLLPRRSAPLWTRAAPAPSDAAGAQRTRASSRASSLRQHGASFFDEIVEGTRTAAHAGRGSSGRAGRARARELGQLLRTARVAHAIGQAQALRRPQAPSSQRSSASRMRVAGRLLRAVPTTDGKSRPHARA